jgi:hypothetical protein
MYKINTITGSLSLDGIIIPQDESSELYVIYKGWLQAGNTVDYTDELLPIEIKETLTNHHMAALRNTASDLRVRAKAAAIDKTGDQSYIFSQVELYELKYKVASGAISNLYMTLLLTNEAAEFGVDFEAFCELIMYMYETAKAKYEIFLLMIERCRTKIQTLIENEAWPAVEQAFALVASLATQEQAQGIMNEILAL